MARYFALALTAFHPVCKKRKFMPRVSQVCPVESPITLCTELPYPPSSISIFLPAKNLTQASCAKENPKGFYLKLGIWLLTISILSRLNLANKLNLIG